MTQHTLDLNAALAYWNGEAEELPRRYYFKPDLDAKHGARDEGVPRYDEDVVTDEMLVATRAESNLVSSEIDDPEGILGDQWGQGPPDGETLHAVAIDLDVPARLVPSSTPGHTHLFIDVPMRWADYQELLAALVNAGIVEGGYVNASSIQGKTLLRTRPRPEPI